MSKFISIITAYWTEPVADNAQKIKSYFGTPEKKTKRLAVSALLCASAALTQSAGALGGPGFAVSALATLPIALASILAVRTGITAYIVTLLLLLIIQPSEIIIFSFTTGLLGLGIGIGLGLFRKRAAVVAFAALLLAAGIAFVLYGIKYPVLGPAASSDFRLTTEAAIYGFSFLYSWLWVEISIINLRFLARALM